MDIEQEVLAAAAAAGQAQQEEPLPEEFQTMTGEQVAARVRLLENEIRVLRDESVESSSGFRVFGFSGFRVWFRFGWSTDRPTAAARAVFVLFLPRRERASDAFVPRCLLRPRCCACLSPRHNAPLTKPPVTQNDRKHMTRQKKL